MEVGRGKDDAVHQVVGHRVDKGDEVVAQPPQNRSNPVTDKGEVVESLSLLTKVFTTLVLNTWSRKTGRFATKPVVPRP